MHFRLLPQPRPLCPFRELGHERGMGWARQYWCVRACVRVRACVHVCACVRIASQAALPCTTTAVAQQREFTSRITISNTIKCGVQPHPGVNARTPPFTGPKVLHSGLIYADVCTHPAVFVLFACTPCTFTIVRIYMCAYKAKLHAFVCKVHSKVFFFFFFFFFFFC